MNDIDLERRLESLTDQIAVERQPLEAAARRGRSRRQRRRFVMVSGTALLAIAGATTYLNASQSSTLTTIGVSAPDENQVNRSTPPSGQPRSRPVPAVVVTSRPAGNEGWFCIRVTVSAASRTGCLRNPGPSLWTVGSDSVIVSSGPLNLVTGVVNPDRSTGVAAFTYDPSVRVVPANPPLSGEVRSLEDCLTPSIGRAVIDRFGPDASAFSVVACGQRSGIVTVEWNDPQTAPFTAVVALDGERGVVRGTLESGDPAVCGGLPESDTNSCRLLMAPFSAPPATT
jgi:hypothetical protein